MFASEKAQHIRLCIGWLCALIVPLWVVNLGVFNESVFGHLAWSARLFATALSACLCLWSFNLVPAFVGGVFIILNLVVLGLVPEKVALSGFGSSGFIMALSFLGIGLCMEQAELGERLYIFAARALRSPSWRRNSIFIIGLLLTMFIPTMPGTGVRLHMLRSMKKYVLRKTPVDNYWADLHIFQGSQILSSVFLSGTTLNLVIVGFLSAQDRARFHWLFWFKSMWAYGAMMVMFHVFCGWWTARKLRDERMSGDNIGTELKGPPLLLDDKVTLCALAVFSISTLSEPFHQIMTLWIGLLILFFLLVFHILREDIFRKKIAWESLILLGSSSGMIASMEYLHIERVLEMKLYWLTDMMLHNYTLFLLGAVFVVWFLRLFLSQGIAAIIMGTFLVPLAYRHGVNAWCIMILIMILAQSWFFPYQSLECRLVQKEMSSAEEKQFLKYNIMMNVGRVVSLFCLVLFWKRLGLL